MVDLLFLLYIYTHINIDILFKVLFHYRLLQDIEYSFLCYIVDPFYLSILCIKVCIC